MSSYFVHSEQLRKTLAKCLITQSAHQLSLHSNRYRAGLFGNDHHEGVAFLGHSKRSFVACMYRRIDSRADRERKRAAGGHDAVLADHNCSVMKSRSRL